MPLGALVHAPVIHNVTLHIIVALEAKMTTTVVTQTRLLRLFREHVFFYRRERHLDEHVHNVRQEERHHQTRQEYGHLYVQLI